MPLTELQKEPPKVRTLADVIEEFEKKFDAVLQFEVHGDKARAPDGQPYVKLYSEGIVTEGQKSVFFETAAEAIRMWEDHADHFIGAKRKILYWRERPRLLDVPEGYQVRARLAVG